MLFIDVTGFPRSGTTWLFRQLQRLPSCEYMREEQGLSAIWDLQHQVGDYSAGFADLFQLGTPTPLLGDLVKVGIHVWKIARLDPARLLDTLCRTKFTSRYYLHKTPAVCHRCGWPEDYVARSAKFTGALVFCCRRQAVATWRSGCRMFPHWPAQFGGFLGFLVQWHAYYDEARERGWTIVDHEAVRADPQGVLDRLCDECFGGCRLQADPFLTEASRCSPQ